MKREGIGKMMRAAAFAELVLTRTVLTGLGLHRYNFQCMTRLAKPRSRLPFVLLRVCVGGNHGDYFDAKCQWRHNASNG